jgi:hypothetical protein
VNAQLLIDSIVRQVTVLVEEHNRQHGLEHHYQQVVHYGGQCVLDRDLDDGDGNDDDQA